jgi:hypothetical protein
MNRERIIEGIFNYCTRRCELCPFTAQCTLYQSEREYERKRPDATWPDRVHDSFAETFHLLEAWCRREGIDFEQIRREAENEEANVELDRIEEAARADPLQTLATGYMHGALNIADAMAAARALRKWPAEVEAAFDAMTWNATMLSAKIHRALQGFGEREVFREDDPVQNDWNGSAKLARILVDESKRAWQLILREGEAPEDSPLVELVAVLDRIDGMLADRFPRAMEFIRPGFDEPPATLVLAPRAGE